MFLQLPMTYQPVHPKGDQSWVFIGTTDAEVETPILWPPHAKCWLIGKDPDAGRDLGAGGEGDDRGWEGWMASPIRCTWVWVNSESWWWTGRSGCCDSWGRKESDTTERLNWTELNWQDYWASLIAQLVKNPPAGDSSLIPGLGNLLEKG